ncbi:hypothetical protein ACI65C_003556 [Semiaphis heraclei]
MGGGRLPCGLPSADRDRNTAKTATADTCTADNEAITAAIAANNILFLVFSGCMVLQEPRGTDGSVDRRRP